ncbi:MAG TPA: lipopolysaccharide assembly protein LapA domain-containing protein [Acidimicrobiia bacterium]|nr:lipopolysaccharide assembly protein LapA domain-containing protein [Acidimicrobiia bacterium]
MTEVPHMDKDEVTSHHDSPAADHAASEEAKGARRENAGERKVFVGTGLFWGLMFGVLFTAAVIVFAAQNTASIEVTFLVWQFATPIIVLILGSVLAGVIIDEVAGLVYRRRKRRVLTDREELKRLRKETGDRPT